LRTVSHLGCSADLASTAKLNPSQYSLFAANKASLDVLGDTVIPFVLDGHAFKADVSVCSKVEDSLLGSDWLEQQGAQWDFASGTVTLEDKSIKVHRRHRTGICRRVVVAIDCIVPAKHEANVPVRMEDDGLPLPPCNWAIEPQGLGPNVMTARTLFSDTQPQLVARVLNNSLKDKLSANSFLSMAEPVQCLSGTDYEPANLLLDGSSSHCDSVLSEESLLPVSSSPASTMMSADGTVLRASSISAATVEAMASGSSPPSPSEGQLDHIESLLHSLPDDFTLNEKLSPDSALEAHRPALQLLKHSPDAGAFVCRLTAREMQGLRRLCINLRKRKFSERRGNATTAIDIYTHGIESASCAGSGTIGPLSNPTGDRYRWLAELMTPDDLDTADPPDTPYQSSVAVAAETWLPPDIIIRLFPRFVRLRRHARRLPRNGQACASLIGQCASSPTSLTRVVGCVVASHVSCYRLRVVHGTRCIVAVNRSALYVDLLDKRLRKVGKMSYRHRNEADERSSSPESSGSSSDFHGDNLPPPDVLRKPPIRMWTDGSAQTEPSGNAGAYRGLGISNRGHSARGRAPMAARGPNR